MEMLKHYSYEIQCSNEELFDIIDKSEHEKILSKDPKPLYKKFVLAHEGESKPRLIGIGKTVLNWSKKAIEKVNDLLNKNVYAIDGHTQDNSNSENKKPLAYVVGKKLEQVGNKLRTVVALYFPEKDRSNYDVISMEASGVNVENNFVNDLLSIPRLALGKSNEVQPAFEGARLIGEYQFFEEIKEQKEIRKNMSPREIKEIIQREGIHFSQLFDVKEVLGEPFKEPDGRITFIKGDDRALAYINRVIPQPVEYEKQLKEKDEFIKKLSEESGLVRKELYKTNSKPLLEKFTKEKNLSDVQVKYLEKTFSTFDPSHDQDIEKQLESWSNKQLESLKTVLELTSPAVENVVTPKIENKNSNMEKNYL